MPELRNSRPRFRTGMHATIEGTYISPNGWSLEWRTVNHIGDLTLYNAEGQRQTATSGVVTQATYDRAVRKLKERAAVEMQPRLFEMEAI